MSVTCIRIAYLVHAYMVVMSKSENYEYKYNKRNLESVNSNHLDYDLAGDNLDS